MKKLVIGLIAICLMFFTVGCSNDNNAKTENIIDSSTDESEKVLSTINLTKWNYSNYLNIDIVQLSQTPTLIQDEGRKYVVVTTFQINASSKNTSYNFNNVSFSVIYPADGESYHTKVYVDTNGNGTANYMISETLSKPSKAYSFNFENTIYNFEGNVQYYEE